MPSIVTDPLPVDPALPQLQTAWNAERMLAVFRAQIRTPGGRGIEIRNCRLSRIRYRPGLRSTVLYELELCESASGTTRTQWVTGTTHAVKSVKGMYKKLLATTEPRVAPNAGIDNIINTVSYIPQLNLLLNVFPMDRRLTALPRFMESPPAEFEASILREFGSGNWRVARRQVVPTRYRPGLGVTLCCTVEAEEPGTRSRRTRRFFVKLYRNDDGRHAYERLRRLHRQCPAAAAFRPVRPIAYLSKPRALILEASPGESLQDLLCCGGNVRPAIEAAATSLADFHHSQIDAGRRRTREAMIQRAERAGRLISWACPSRRDVVNAIMELLKIELRDCDVHLPAHLDMKLDHIFVHGDRAVFIDWDSFAMADPVFDVASLLVRLKIAPILLPVSKDAADKASSILASEYFQRVPSAWKHRLPANYALAAMKAALYFVQHLEGDRDRKVALLLDEAYTGLSGFAPPRRRSH